MYSYVARQPILDANKSVIAYELLFRDGKSNSFPNIDPNQATSNILTNNHLTLGVEKITAGKPAFINFHAKTLIKRFPSFLDPKKVVIEILEDIDICDELVSAVKSLKKKGYQLALDDHDFDPKWEVLFPYIDIIKIDVLETPILKLSKFVRETKKWDITLLAEKVETKEQFDKLKMLGFDQFQGYFFAKPEMMKQRKVITDKQSLFELLHHANQRQLDFDAISLIFSSDPGLTYKLLRFINSPTYGTSQEITSLKHALIYIGEVELKKFISLLALSDLAQRKCSEVTKLSLVRAKFCELIANKRNDEENPPKAFLTGMLSLIDGILDHDLDYVLSVLPIHEEIKAALLQQGNYLDHYLSLVKHIEQGQWRRSQAKAASLELSESFCLVSYQEAIEWADGMLSVTESP